MKVDGRRDPVRLRAFNVTDADLDELSAYVTATPAGEVSVIRQLPERGAA